MATPDPLRSSRQALSVEFMTLGSRPIARAVTKHPQMWLGLTAFLAAGCSDDRRRDATEEEVRSVASKCGATITHFYQAADEEKLSNRKLGTPNVSVTIDIKNNDEFVAKANCIDRELNTLGAYALIGGPNGEDLLVSDGRDRID